MINFEVALSVKEHSDRENLISQVSRWEATEPISYPIEPYDYSKHLKQLDKEYESLDLDKKTSDLLTHELAYKIFSGDNSSAMFLEFSDSSRDWNE